MEQSKMARISEIGRKSKEMYKYELHCHDILCSACAHSTPKEMVDAYAAKDFSGMVFTNHFLLGNTSVNTKADWTHIVDEYYNAYLEAVNAAPTGFTVMFGLEHKYCDSGQEMLTYGITREFLLENENIHLLPIEEYVRLVREAGGFLSQAHPYRHASYISMISDPDLSLVDAIESFNLFNSDQENKQAETFAEKHNLYQCSGGDIHDKEGDIGQAGMAFPYKINSNTELVAALKKHDGKRIVKGIINK